MYKNYFYLNRFIIEADAGLKGFVLYSAFSQEKNRLILAFRNAEDTAEEKFIEISVDHSVPFITLRKRYSRAKKNTVEVFSDYLPSPIISAGIKEYDRVVEIKTSAGGIYFLIRGKFTNVIFISGNGEVVPFKTNEEEDTQQLKEEIVKATFTSRFSYPQFDTASLEDIKKKYPFVGREILKELSGRLNEGSSTKVELTKIIEEISTAHPAVYHLNEYDEYELLFDNFKIIPESEIKNFDSTSEALYFFFSRKFSADEVKTRQASVRKFIDKALTKLSAKLNNVQSLLNEGSKEEKYNEIGNLLLINISQLRHGMKKIELFNIYKDKQEEIQLDPALPPKKNIDRYFEKARDEKIKIAKAADLVDILNKDYEKLKRLSVRAEASTTKDEILQIMKELKMKENVNISSKDEPLYNFKNYVIEGKYNLYVGRDSKNNDELTTRFAKQNDYWFHARGLPGSHVVLRNDNPKEGVPKSVIKKAAAIAAYHSKGKTAGLIPVSYAQKKYVVKKKGMGPGKVAMLKEEVLLVRPEIPEGCEYIEK